MLVDIRLRLVATCLAPDRLLSASGLSERKSPEDISRTITLLLERSRTLLVLSVLWREPLEQPGKMQENDVKRVSDELHCQLDPRSSDR